MKSIRRKLVLSLSLTLLIAIVSSGVMGLLVVRQEVDEVFNADLVVTAEIIKGLINGPDLANNREFYTSALNETLAGLRTIPPAVQTYEKKLLLQVWSGDGSELIFRSPNGPRAALAPLQKGFYHHAEGDEYWDVYVTELPAIHGWLQVAEIPDARTEILEDMAGIFIVSGIFVLAVCGLLAVFAVTYGLSPLRQLGSILQARTLNNLTPVSLEKPPSELKPVITGLNQMFERMTAGLERERRFVADAAHELRTPLAVLKLQTQHLQTLLGKQCLNETEQLERGVERGHRVVEQLLLLARLDDQRSYPQGDSTDVVETCRRTIADLYPLVDECKAVLTLENTDDSPSCSINPVLLDIALRNLLENALRYGGQGVHVAVSVTEMGDKIAVSVRDNGPGVSDADLLRLSERFYRASSANSSGAGLGLSIVQRIVEGLSGEMQFSNVDSGGLQVTLIFPRAS